MKYYSTNHKSPEVSLRDAVVNGLASDGGLYMPQFLYKLPEEFFDVIGSLSFNDIAKIVASALFGEDVDATELDKIVDDTLSFDCPVVRVDDNIFSLELFHGPTMAFKDVGARFMARLLRYFTSDRCESPINVLVATSGDTGSAVANGFLDVDGVHVFVLYPKGKVSKIQESQFVTLGRNITPVEVDGVFDDCQSLVKKAFVDSELNSKMMLTSANSINVARFLPQSFYYFIAYARMKAEGLADNLVIAVPSGNFGNLTAGLFAREMGLPVKRFVAANNLNDTFCQYLKTGYYTPKASVQTVANAMDVGNPSNFARLMDMYESDWTFVKSIITAHSYTDDQILHTVKSCFNENGYILDPHGACGYQSLKDELNEGEKGVFLETAHPAKFKEKIEAAIGSEINIPQRLAAFMEGKKQSIGISTDYNDFRTLLLDSNNA